ncbi:hypothetical protein AXG93_1626s1120 [Marchantia polymorpha subsp. ruderalis]|uniref:Uncharacterized protein n=1 Tax=Marchantia polymorpha subsp. ruderalis TaxID=1480154 RepID=A0A176W9N9_MARPO|nr:hypothetical protein AXG93_1626s1120 [Marchantia polymorpha subsp. ruderalis]
MLTPSSDQYSTKRGGPNARNLTSVSAALEVQLRINELHNPTLDPGYQFPGECTHSTYDKVIRTSKVTADLGSYLMQEVDEVQVEVEHVEEVVEAVEEEEEDVEEEDLEAFSASRWRRELPKGLSGLGSRDTGVVQFSPVELEAFD